MVMVCTSNGRPFVVLELLDGIELRWGDVRQKQESLFADEQRTLTRQPHTGW